MATIEEITAVAQSVRTYSRPGCVILTRPVPLVLKPDEYVTTQRLLDLHNEGYLSKFFAAISKILCRDSRTEIEEPVIKPNEIVHAICLDITGKYRGDVHLREKGFWWSPHMFDIVKNSGPT
jgi:hypothetical protein